MNAPHACGRLSPRFSIRNAAEADVRDLKVAPSRFALLHCCRVVHLLFRDKLCAGRRELFSLILRDFGIFEVEQLHRLDNRRRDDEENHLLSAGTTNQGASFDAVAQIASS